MLVVYFLFAIFMINTMSALFIYQEAKKLTLPRRGMTYRRMNVFKHRLLQVTLKFAAKVMLFLKEPKSF